MYFNVSRLYVVRQIHCLCKSQSLLKSNCIRSQRTEIQVKFPCIQHIRSISSNSNNEKEVILESKKDSLSEVYRGTLTNFIFRVKAFSLLTSVFGIGTQPFVLYNAMEADANTVFLIGACTFVGFFTFVTPLLLHSLTKRYILRLQYCPKTDQYYATTYSFFLGDKTDKFHINDVNVPDIPGMLTTFEIKERPFFIDKEGFFDLHHYKKIMGYDKPLDFKLNKSPSVKKG